jgi:hypothetical protein
VAWAGSVGELCDVVDRLGGLAAELGAPSPDGAEWHGQLFGKLRPQVTREPVMVAAVCGGTNTGKSLVSNVLVGAEISRSLPEAARTRCPVASLPRGLAKSVDLAALFPGFTPRAWSSDTDGSEMYTLRIRDLSTNTDLPDEIPNTTWGGTAWSANDEWLFYVVPDEAMRPHQVWRHQVGTASSGDVLVLEDADERFFVGLSESRSG